MQQILVYADSLSWGIIPDSRARFAFAQRWPGIMETTLAEQGMPVRVIEDCLNGRRTTLEDPLKAGRNGLQGLAQRIEINSPLALVVLLLGTNDFQAMHSYTPAQSAQGLSCLVDCIRHAPIEPGMPIPAILLVAPPPIQTAKGSIATKFAGAEHKAVGLAAAIQQIAQQQNCHFFNTGSVTATSRVDGVHLDADQHLLLGQALAAKVHSLLS